MIRSAGAGYCHSHLAHPGSLFTHLRSHWLTRLISLCSSLSLPPVASSLFVVDLSYTYTPPVLASPSVHTHSESHPKPHHVVYMIALSLVNLDQLASVYPDESYSFVAPCSSFIDTCPSHPHWCDFPGRWPPLVLLFIHPAPVYVHVLLSGLALSPIRSLL